MYKPKKPYVCFPHMHSTLIPSNSHMCWLKLVQTQRLQHPKSKSKYFIVPPAIKDLLSCGQKLLCTSGYMSHNIACKGWNAWWVNFKTFNHKIMKIYQWKITTIFFFSISWYVRVKVAQSYLLGRERIKNVTSRFLCVVSAWTGLLRVSTKTLII